MLKQEPQHTRWDLLLISGFAAVAFLCFGYAHHALAAGLELNPPTGTYVVGSIVPVDVLVESDGSVINAVSGEVRYDSEFLQAVSVSRNNSIIDLWLEEPSVTVNSGSVVFEGLILNPGFTGSGKAITINFKVLAPGRTTTTFVSGLVLANDGFGTNVVDRLQGATLTLLAAQSGVPARTVSLPGEAMPSGGTLVAPVVIGYTSNPPTLNDLMIRGVTYPNIEVHVFLKPKADPPARMAGGVEEYMTSSDAGGNFVYRHRDHAKSRQLQSANVFSILEPLARGSAYQFWLTAVQSDVETDPTQPFDVVAGQGSGMVRTVAVAGSALLVFMVMFLSVRHYFVSRRRFVPVGGAPYAPPPKGEMLKDIRKDIDSLAYDVEKYSGVPEHDKRHDAPPSHDDRK
jgi:hypothetical protein